MNMPGFTAEVTLYKTNRYYQLAGVLPTDTAGQLSPAVLKGTTCTVSDPSCASGFSKLMCTGFDPDSCTETGICCTPTTGGGGGGGQTGNCGNHSCSPGHPCCGSGCCQAGTHCCSNVGCCPNGTTCRSIFGHHFCSPI